ncbi:hypothetical protein CK203_032161 [Vitis vinifera]|uniref:Uncharacterized protein n=1 Tax=Vitis vinifera TaxID=29760 RepID=A0A438IPR8_VITVI|nr:hypothetical protein CK203_032161 [Vitis vinifera]
MEEDLALWKGGKNGKFEVKEAYELLISHSTCFFRKRAFGWRTFLQSLRSLRGKLLGGGFSRLIGYQREGGSFLIAVIYAAWMRKTSTISYTIVQWLECMGDCPGLVGAQWVFPESCKRR